MTTPSFPKYTKGEASSSQKVKEEDSTKYETHKECLVKGVDPLDGEYIDSEINEKFEQLAKSMKEELK
uniref:Uncharacterized protein n=1 Tax=Aegilops tauschii subsp. strangulata TaxID=200361 RepID=A0A453GMH3_AEGTS